MKEHFITLAIESSCDDTSIAILDKQKVLCNITANQDVHALYGGVVPELASREHQKHLIPLLSIALKKVNLKLAEVDQIAYTSGPGLLGALLVGSSFAKGVALATNIDLVAVNHMQAHILAHFIENDRHSYPVFPFLSLTVSGGHTQMVLVKDFTNFEIIGETIDDAAGEAFDKIAKLFGFSYPGGPLIDKHAKLGNPNAFNFPVTLLNDYKYSFSGIKTAVLYFLQKQLKQNKNFINTHLNDLCASVQKCIVDMLLIQFKKAAEIHKVNSICLGGGVAANSELRARFLSLASMLQISGHIPDFQFCTDNAAMIGVTAYLQKDANTVANCLQIPPNARLSVEEAFFN